MLTWLVMVFNFSYLLLTAFYLLFIVQEQKAARLERIALRKAAREANGEVADMSALEKVPTRLG